MKKLLILGQIPKEYGGSYTTGVGNVIIELASILQNDFETYVFATNFKSKRIVNKIGIKFLGYSYKKVFYLLLREILSPIKIIKELIDYKKNYGVPAIKFLIYRILIGNYIKKINPNFINAHGMIFSPVIKHLKLSKKVLFTFHGFMHMDVNSIKANKERGIHMGKLYVNGAKNIYKPIYLTKPMKEIGENNLSIRGDFSNIISNGVNSINFKYCKTSRSILRLKMNVKKSEEIIISVGALTHRKNHLGFIKYLERNDFEGQYWIVGKFEAEETKEKILEYQNRVKSFTINIIEYVPNKELYKYYSAADVYAHPSTSEGQALVVFEALCCGLPLVVNQEIEGTFNLGGKYKNEVKYINLEDSKTPCFKNIKRENLSIKCKEDFSWEKAAGQYKNLFLSEKS